MILYATGSSLNMAIANLQSLDQLRVSSPTSKPFRVQKLNLLNVILGTGYSPLRLNYQTNLRSKLDFCIEINPVFLLLVERPWPLVQCIVQSTLLSVLDFGDIIHMHVSPSTLKPLDSVYHGALRLITGDAFLIHRCTLYEKVG